MSKKTTKKAVAKKATAKKSAKKAVAKKAPAKKVAKKTTAKTRTPKKPVNPLDAMLKTIEKAKKKGETSVVAFTTAKEHHNETSSGGGLGVNDLKPEYLNAYKHLLCNFNLDTRLVNMSDKAVEWIVKF